MDTNSAEFKWEELYRTTPAEQLPWYYPELDHDFDAALKGTGIERGAVLDLGSGPGTQAIALAQRGFDVVGTDISETAVFGAAAAARQRGVHLVFGQDDILDTKLAKQFDLVLDRGCFHTLPLEQRRTYAANVQRILAPGGHFFLKTFSTREPGTDGPHRLTEQEIRDTFEPLFHIQSIQNSHFKGVREPWPHALFAVMSKAGQ